MKYVLLPLLLCWVTAGVTASPPLTVTKWEKESEVEDADFWNEVGQTELSEALEKTMNSDPAKNVILFLGDGMSISTLTAARIYKGQMLGEGDEGGKLSFENFPFSGLSKTYNVDYMVPDSAGTATAYLSGVKTNKGTIGVDSTVEKSNCESVTEMSKVDSIFTWAQAAGKRTGVVTTTRITHATPAAAYAHVADRDWECDALMPDKCGLKDIARQLVEDAPGNKLNVIFGGGFQYLDGKAVDLPGDPVDKNECIRQDNKQLWKTWLDEKTDQGLQAKFVRSRTDLNKVDLTKTEYLMGIFSNDHQPYEYQKRDQNLDMPTITEMTQKAINLLKEGPNGYVLLVEGGRIDGAHHDNNAKIALDETVAMSDAIEGAINILHLNETLVVVTADHAHTMTLNGYPERGTDILAAPVLDDDGMPYNTLSYANGDGFNDTYVVSTSCRGGESKCVVRKNLTGVDVTPYEYLKPGGIYKDGETHGGDDVAIYATGPMAHLFTSLHEQNFIAHGMAYASCIGENQDLCSDAPIIPAWTTLTAILPTLLIINWRFA